MIYKIFFVFLVSIFFVFKYFSFDDNSNIGPVNLTTQTCSIDEMILMEWNGPKAQILWKNNKRTFYCDVKEIFYEVLNDVSKGRIKFIYVQDFSNLSWGAYPDKWIKAEDAFFVIDSFKKGAMNLSYVPFSDKKSAELFILENSGILLKFNDINMDVFNSSYKKNMLRNI